MVVERALADSHLGRNGIDADGANPALVKQAIGRFQNALLHGLFCGPRCHCRELRGLSHCKITRVPCARLMSRKEQDKSCGSSARTCQYCSRKTLTNSAVL